MKGRIHVVGAGLAGLAAAVAAARDGATVSLYEAAAFAGGRCRSYYDATLGLHIDNGNHLVLSGNRETMDYARLLGSAERLVGPPTARFPFVDLATDERWTVALSDSRVPWWILDPKRRVPGTRLVDYLLLLKLLRATPRQTIGERIAGDGLLYHRLLQPLLLAALNTEPLAASASLAAAVIRETLSAGGRACRPLVARTGLSDVFVDPALAYLRARRADVQLGRRLRRLLFAPDAAPAGAHATRLVGLDFGDNNGGNNGGGTVMLDPADTVILALPAQSATGMVPGLTAPNAFRSIVNAHYRIAPPVACPPLVGVINGTAEWVFAFDDRLSVTISGADRLLDIERETLARTIWQDVARTVWGTAASHPVATMPPWQIVRERRATFAALPAQDARRPATQTNWNNLFLAGDWTRTGLPATIEGAVRSGNLAARAAVTRGRGP